ncbi:MAG TPA: tail fiber protein [Dokdonella sp.]
MSEPFIGQISIVGFNFPPRGWAQCNGQLMPIAQNTALFSLLGISYGGNGQTTFALPDLRGRAPMCFGNGPGLTPRPIGGVTGSTAVSLLVQEMPAHTHVMNAQSTRADRGNANDARFAASADPTYSTQSPSSQLGPNSVIPTGSGMPHNNMQPFQALNFIIALDGIFPSRN